MARIEKRVQIAAPLERVFSATAGEWERDLSFFEGLTDYRPSAGQRLGDGFQLSYKLKTMGTSHDVEMIISGYAEGQGWTARSTKGPEIRGDWSFSRSPIGTEVTYVLDYEVPVPLAGEILDTLVVRREWEKSVEQSLENLKTLIEEGS